MQFIVRVGARKLNFQFQKNSMLQDIEDFQEPIIERITPVSVKITHTSVKTSTSSFEVPTTTVDQLLPGNARIYIKTWGCSHNNSDSEYMAGLLQQQGYEIVFESALKNTCQLFVLNSCTVKGPSQQTFINDIKQAITEGKKVVVCGCVPQGAPNEDYLGCSVIGVQQIDKICFAVEETLKGNNVRYLKDKKRFDSNGRKLKSGGADLKLPKIRRNFYIEIIPINTGCLNQCTYCKTKHARGDLGSYLIEEITDRVQQVLKEGVLEIWLTSEDIGAYGLDIDTNIVELLNAIIVVLEKYPKAMLRIGMTNPPYILTHLKEIARILNHSQVYSFLHVPVQSGSTRVLETMKRQYTIEDFNLVCDTLRSLVPSVTIATDLICGNFINRISLRIRTRFSG